ncbi:MAG: alcohol dehydrogenase catalytic domain-containing protein [Phycisphaerae bacterium]|jgi:threonine dehydrogenase-like Zn-dependent dehydrogenase|nr:alcohol dehydrogenase catalytic domain-containing protein [Phycisphaerae bacterium]
MKAAFQKGTAVAVREATLPAIKPDEIRIDLEACGVCGTDLHVPPQWQDAERGFGHEMAGTILEVGSAVTRVSAGQKVAIESSSSCGKCENCRNALQKLCLDKQTIFNSDYYGFAEQAVAPAICAVPYEGMSPEVASLSEPLGVSIDIFRVADIPFNSNVLVMGQGPIGLMALALVKKAGARRVFASEMKWRTARVELSKQFGADEVIDPTETPIEEFDFGCKIDRILVTSPPITLQGAMDVAANGAIIAFIGIAYGDGAFCRFDANKFHFKKLQLRASFASPALRTALALKYLREGVIDGEAVVTHRYPLENIVEAMDVAGKDPSAVKVVIQL